MKPTANVKHLVERAELLKQTRAFFDRNGFVEVQPPCLMRDCVVDAYLDPITVNADQCRLSDPGVPDRLYLQTSPESAMKRMLAAGAPSIYSLGPVFRSGEAGRLHNVEFTMLEWYEVGGDLESAIGLAGQYLCEVLNQPRFEKLTYRQAFGDQVGLDPVDATTDHLRREVAAVDGELAASIGDDRDQLLDVLMSSRVAPVLGTTLPMAITDYPLSQAALAKPSINDVACAARFEFFVRGIEVANGYDELLDPDVLIGRAVENNRKRERSGREPLKVETTLVQAMRQGLPQCSGVALGFDRLLMLKANADSIAGVLPFSIFDA